MFPAPQTQPRWPRLSKCDQMLGATRCMLLGRKKQAILDLHLCENRIKAKFRIKLSFGLYHLKSYSFRSLSWKYELVSSYALMDTGWYKLITSPRFFLSKLQHLTTNLVSHVWAYPPRQHSTTNKLAFTTYDLLSSLRKKTLTLLSWSDPHQVKFYLTYIPLYSQIFWHYIWHSTKPWTFQCEPRGLKPEKLGWPTTDLRSACGGWWYDINSGDWRSRTQSLPLAREDFVAARYMLCTSASLERIIHLTGGFTLDCQKTWNDQHFFCTDQSFSGIIRWRCFKITCRMTGWSLFLEIIVFWMFSPRSTRFLCLGIASARFVNEIPQSYCFNGESNAKLDSMAP